MEKVTVRDERGNWMTAQVTGDGPPILLVHGIPGSASSWSHVVPLLIPQHRVIVPDLVGFGASSRSDNIDDLWTDRQADLLERVLAEVGAPRVAIAAHDYGGPVVLTLLRRRHDLGERLVLAATNTFGDTPIPFPLSGMFLPIVGKAWARMLFSAPSLRMMARMGSKGRADATAAVGDGEQARAIGIIFETALRELRERYGPIQRSLGELRVPTTVMWGTADPFFPLTQGERTAAAIPGAKLVKLPDAGHFLPEERPASFADILLNA